MGAEKMKASYSTVFEIIELKLHKNVIKEPALK